MLWDFSNNYSSSFCVIGHKTIIPKLLLGLKFGVQQPQLLYNRYTELKHQSLSVPSVSPELLSEEITFFENLDLSFDNFRSQSESSLELSMGKSSSEK